MGNAAKSACRYNPWRLSVTHAVYSRFHNSVTIANARSAGPPRSGPRPPTRVGAWLGLMSLWLISHLPLRVSRALGGLLGELIYHTNAKRRHVAQVNIDLCFPILSPEKKALLVRRHFRLLGQSYLDIAFLAW